MSTDLSAIKSGLATGASATSTVADVVLVRRFELTGAAQNESFTLPGDPGEVRDLNARMIITVAGSAATNTRYKIKQNGVSIIEMVAGSAAGNSTVYSTASAALLARPTSTSATFATSALVDVAVRGDFILTFNRN